MNDELALVVNGSRVSGWEQVEVTLRCEGFPNSFSIGLSSRDPNNKGIVVAAAGDACQVYLGDDLVITGYIDRDSNGGTASGHQLKLVGRGKCCDLVDCSAEWPSGLISGDALAIASAIAKPYQIDVQLANGASAGPQVPQWALNYGETGAAIVQRVAQNAGLLAYENNQGRLLLSSVGATQAASGVVYGQNVEEWSVENSMDQRFSEVVCVSFSVASYGDVEGNDFFDTEPDPNVKRHRRMDIALEDVASPEGAQAFTIRKAKWEVARRAGRATLVSARVDSWRDKAGALWAPNTMIPVDLPGLRIPDRSLCLSEVTFRKDADGTHAELTLLPKAAFELEPISLLPSQTADVAALPDGQ